MPGAGGRGSRGQESWSACGWRVPACATGDTRALATRWLGGAVGGPAPCAGDSEARSGWQEAEPWPPTQPRLGAASPALPGGRLGAVGGTSPRAGALPECSCLRPPSPGPLSTPSSSSTDSGESHVG